MINMIVAVDRNLGIGCNNKLLAQIKPDMEYFKKVTANSVVVMGYNTYMSIPKRPLPNRVNIVLTSKNIELEGAIVVSSIDELIDTLDNYKKEIYIIGGASVYKQMMPYADMLYITHVFDSFEADSFFPEIDECWEVENITAEKENLFHKHPHVFAVYKRK
ncbi:dihydrofolate reductase [Clostridium swellfunianum]|uniref:dihydrofolate reductase n=1 Tax=Clostridium swellfunianum TaxID=1367462 RepID=UPI00203012A5|nr:dihydrofolate reductase [Clostridium swellfunianum]MCM0647991.1 dihydrofolate reductase [Clostridium swellfunianum]